MWPLAHARVSLCAGDIRQMRVGEEHHHVSLFAIAGDIRKVQGGDDERNSGQTLPHFRHGTFRLRRSRAKDLQNYFRG